MTLNKIAGLVCILASLLSSAAQYPPPAKTDRDEVPFATVVGVVSHPTLPVATVVAPPQGSATGYFPSRRAFVRPDGSKDLEPVAFIDMSKSMNGARRDKLLSILLATGQLFTDADDQAAAEKANGKTEYGLRAIGFARNPLLSTSLEPLMRSPEICGEDLFRADQTVTYAAMLGDLNPENLLSKKWPIIAREEFWKGGTFIVPALMRFEKDFLQEFGQDESGRFIPKENRPDVLLLVICDGQFADFDRFKSEHRRLQGELASIYTVFALIDFHDDDAKSAEEQLTKGLSPEDQDIFRFYRFEESADSKRIASLLFSMVE